MLQVIKAPTARGTIFVFVRFGHTYIDLQNCFSDSFSVTDTDN